MTTTKETPWVQCEDHDGTHRLTDKCVGAVLDAPPAETSAPGASGSPGDAAREPPAHPKCLVCGKPATHQSYFTDGWSFPACDAEDCQAEGALEEPAAPASPPGGAAPACACGRTAETGCAKARDRERAAAAPAPGGADLGAMLAAFELAAMREARRPALDPPGDDVTVARSALVSAWEAMRGVLVTETKERERCRDGWQECAANLEAEARAHQATAEGLRSAIERATAAERALSEARAALRTQNDLALDRLNRAVDAERERDEARAERDRYRTAWERAEAAINDVRREATESRAALARARGALAGLPCMWVWRAEKNGKPPRAACADRMDPVYGGELPEHAWCPTCRARALAQETPAGTGLPPEIREILRDAKDGTTGVCIRERAAAAIVARDLCPRCAGTGMELLDTGPGGPAAWGTCHGCRAPAGTTNESKETTP
jgi:hypothetical protein